jgi:hypothetical protein
VTFDALVVINRKHNYKLFVNHFYVKDYKYGGRANHRCDVSMGIFSSRN